MESKEKIYRNVKTLAKIKNEKLSDVEEQVGLSQGYLSRCSGRGINIDNVYKLAKHFGITIEELITANYESVLKKESLKVELCEAVNNAKSVMNGMEILEIVNKELEKET